MSVVVVNETGVGSTEAVAGWGALSSCCFAGTESGSAGFASLDSVVAVCGVTFCCVECSVVVTDEISEAIRLASNAMGGGSVVDCVFVRVAAVGRVRVRVELSAVADVVAVEAGDLLLPGSRNCSKDRERFIGKGITGVVDWTAVETGAPEESEGRSFFLRSGDAGPAVVRAGVVLGCSMPSNAPNTLRVSLKFRVGDVLSPGAGC